MFGGLFKKKDNKMILGAPVKGKAVPLSEVNDPTFEEGTEILIHVGLDTVKMNGEGFTGHVKAGDKVKKGDLLLEVDLDKVKAAGYDTITPMLVCNTMDYASVEGVTGKDVEAGDDAVIIEK